MFTYQVRPRIFRLAPGGNLDFPTTCELRFHLLPSQAFGTSAGGGRTCVRAVPASAFFDANSGRCTIESKEPLSPLEVTLEAPNRKVRLLGKTLTVIQDFGSLDEVNDMIQAIYFLLPLLLNIPFVDPPYIERIDGSIGTINFRWELEEWQVEFRTTGQLLQEQRFAKSWERLSLLCIPTRRRLIAGLHYFHVACRLAMVSCTAGEFVAEVILNLSKCLEVLFPPGSRDAVRDGLQNLGYSAGDVERDFIPAMLLRKEIDVAHVELAMFTTDQLKTIHAYTERAEVAFRDMLERLLTRIESGQSDIAPYEFDKPRRETVKLIEQLKKNLPSRFQ